MRGKQIDSLRRGAQNLKEYQISMNNPKVQILMNCFNGEAYLQEAIESLNSQTYPHWEILFIDNQSSDSSVEIAKSLTDKIQIHTTPEPMSLGSAREFGMQFFDADYLCFLDVDDMWEPQKLELQLKAFEKHPKAGMCYGSVDYIDEAGKLVSDRTLSAQSGNLFGVNLAQYYVCSLTPMITRQALAAITKPYFEPKLKHSPDYYLYMQLLLKFDGICLPEKLGKYRVHAASLTQRNTHVWAEEMQFCLDHFKKDPQYSTRCTDDQEKQALAKIAYYEACSEMKKNNRKQARRHLQPYKNMHRLYKVLYLSTYSKTVWDLAHRFKMKSSGSINSN